MSFSYTSIGLALTRSGFCDHVVFFPSSPDASVISSLDPKTAEETLQKDIKYEWEYHTVWFPGCCRSPQFIETRAPQNSAYLNAPQLVR